MQIDSELHSGHRQRLRDKIALDDLENMNDHEFLESMLFFVIQRKDTNGLAHALLKDFGSLTNIFLATKQQLMQTSGVSENVAQFLISLPKLSKRMAGGNSHLEVLTTTNDFVYLFEPLFRDAKEELTYIAFTRENSTFIATKMLDKGSSNKIKLRVKEILDLALKYNAKNVALAHNHPNNICQPSADDIVSTAKISRILQAMDINLIEHIVFGNNGCTSFIHTVNRLNKGILLDTFKHERDLEILEEDNRIIDIHSLDVK